MKKKKYFESENLSIDSSKAKKLLYWNNKFNEKESLKFTFEWYQYFYSKRLKKKIIDLSFNQIKKFILKHRI